MVKKFNGSIPMKLSTPPAHIKYCPRTKLILTLTLTLTLFSPTWAEERKPVKPSPKDKCPVCGMFVAKYPDFLAEVLFTDGSYVFFDGPKDMFKYSFNLKKYSPSKKESDLKAIYVTDYYSLGLIDGFRATYVLGSDIYGPMGKELIPFGKEEEAKEFMKDHKGKAILRFKDVTSEVIKDLD
jgi:nitrous oxide reductase accessory protein NosL